MADVSIKSELVEGYRVKNSARNHNWFSDEPEDKGGDDSAPKPGELFLSALASCKLITMRMYGLRKGWSVDDLKIDLEILERGDKTIILKKISFPADLDSDQCKRLTEISGRCPVAKMVKDSVEYVIQ